MASDPIGFHDGQLLGRVAGSFLCVLLAACPGPKVAPPDAGRADAGGLEAGFDGGLDGAVEAGPDAGPDDGGEDAGFDAGEPDAGPYLRCFARDSGVPDGGLLRVIAANLSSGNLQSYDPGEGARILQGLKPDVVLIQEWNLGNKSDVDRRAWINANFGEEFCFQVESAQLPNGVISRYPILDAGNWVDSQVPNRSYVWAQIDVPGPRDLWAVSLHLRTSTTAQRNLEAAELVANINQFVPAGDLLVIGGDLNTGSRSEATIATLAQVVRTVGPHPADGSNNQNTNAGRSSPYDWVLPNLELALLQVPVALGDAGFDAGLVFDSRVFNPLSDVAPVQAGDSAAPSMQHMAVVKDFLLP